MADLTSLRRWVPSIFIEDICPNPRARPEDWIATHPNGAKWLFSDDVCEQQPVRVDIGDIVRFNWVVDHGTFEITLHPNGSWSCDDALPEGANGFMEPSDTDTYAETMDEFASNYVAVGRNTEDEPCYVKVLTWSDDLYFRLHKADGSKLVFSQVAMANLETQKTPTPQVVNGHSAGLSFIGLRAANIARQKIWCPDPNQQPDLAFRGIELAGETGEALNVIKKLERENRGWVGSRSTKQDLADELADVVICADLVSLSAGIDLDQAVRTKFNATSAKVGIPVTLGPSQEA